MAVVTLADRIADWLALAGSATCEQIARGLRTRTAEVRRTLRDDPRFVSLLEREDVRQRVIYRLRPSDARDGQGRAQKAKKPSHCEQIKQLLSDHAWHDHHQLYRISCVAHSRIADLRNKYGLTIETRTRRADGETIYDYRLVGKVGESESSTRVNRISSLSPISPLTCAVATESGVPCWNGAQGDPATGLSSLHETRQGIPDDPVRADRPPTDTDNRQRDNSTSWTLPKVGDSGFKSRNEASASSAGRLERESAQLVIEGVAA